MNSNTILNFRCDSTIRCPCRKGDFLFWFRWNNVFSGSPSLEMKDFWRMRNGDFVTITNRWDDLPPWFELYPTEASGSFAYRMMNKIENGYKPGSPMEGSNLWKIRIGDILVWVGNSRILYESIEGILALVKFSENALAVGETNHPQGVNEFISFGTSSRLKEDEVKRAQITVEIVKQLGLPRSISTEWSLG